MYTRPSWKDRFCFRQIRTSFLQLQSNTLLDNPAPPSETVTNCTVQCSSMSGPHRFDFIPLTGPHPPETCLLCRWSSRCIHQLCSWCDPTQVCIQLGSLASDGRWSTWLCPSRTGWRWLRTSSSPQLCRRTPHIWSPKFGSWCETCKRRGTHRRWSANMTFTIP